MDWHRTGIFHGNKKIVGQDLLISYPDFSEIFIIHTEARKMQPGRVISGKWESIDF